MSIIIFTPLKACSDYRWGKNISVLADAYLWATTGKSRKGFNYARMMRDPVPKKEKKCAKAGWPKGVKRMYRGKAIREK